VHLHITQAVAVEVELLEPVAMVVVELVVVLMLLV
jgi:hypothetical protein